MDCAAFDAFFRRRYVTCDHPAGRPCACLDRITAALDELCADLASHGDQLASPAHSYPARPERP